MRNELKWEMLVIKKITDKFYNNELSWFSGIWSFRVSLLDSVASEQMHLLHSQERVF